MSILSTIFRGEKYLKGTEGYQKMSEWQLAKDVEYENGKNGEEVISDIKEQLTAGDTPFRFGVNDSGEYGYIITDSEGADTVIPFKRGYKIYNRRYNSTEATWKVPTNSSGNTSSTVGVLGRNEWTNLCNSTYKYKKGFILPLTEFEDLDYIYKNPDKIKYVTVRLFPTLNASEYYGYYQFRLSRPSGYMYYHYYDWFEPVVFWHKDLNNNRICGQCGLTASNVADTGYLVSVCIYDGSDGTQPRIDFADNFEVVSDYQFKGYMGYELTIVYE